MKPYTTVIEIIRNLAEQQPDKKSEDKYFDYDDQTPDCIFGHALAELGGKPDRYPVSGVFAVVNAEREFVVKGYQSASVIEWPLLGIEYPTEEQANWSDAVQKYQDNGDTWADAVELASR